MAVARAFNFPLDSGGTDPVISETNWNNRPGGSTPWVSETQLCEDVRQPEGYFALNRNSFAAGDTYEIRFKGRMDPGAPWAQLLPTLTHVASTAEAISVAGVDWDSTANIVASLEGLATTAVPLTPEIRVEVHALNEAVGVSLAMVVWLLSDV